MSVINTFARPSIDGLDVLAHRSGDLGERHDLEVVITIELHQLRPGDVRSEVPAAFNGSDAITTSMHDGRRDDVSDRTRSGYVAANSTDCGPPSDAPIRCARSMTAASITPRMSSIHSSNEKFAAPSDTPIPRLSYTIAWAKSAIGPAQLHMLSIVTDAPEVKTTSSPSPAVRYPIATPS